MLIALIVIFALGVAMLPPKGLVVLHGAALVASMFLASGFFLMLAIGGICAIGFLLLSAALVGQL